MEERKKVTIPDLYSMVARGKKITFLTAYDYPTALLEDRAGIIMRSGPPGCGGRCGPECGG